MLILYILLIAAGAFPLVAFLIKRQEYHRLLKSGTKTNARVTKITTHQRTRGVGSNYDSVVYAYQPANSNQQFYGLLISKIDKYKIGDVLELYYLPDKPQKKALAEVKYNIAGFIFVLCFFLAVLFACYKIYEMLNTL